MGRSAILGEQRNNYFCDVGCGRGEMVSDRVITLPRDNEQSSELTNCEGYAILCFRETQLTPLPSPDFFASSIIGGYLTNGSNSEPQGDLIYDFILYSLEFISHLT